MPNTVIDEGDGPVVVIRDDGPGAQCRNREFEWYAALVLISIAASIFVTPRTIEVGAFRYLLQMGFSVDHAWVMYGIIGTTRVAVLLLNGNIPFYGPHIRAILCVISALIWGMMAVALVRLTEDTGTLSLGIGAWGWATVFELRSLHRALIDVGRS